MSGQAAFNSWQPRERGGEREREREQQHLQGLGRRKVGGEVAEVEQAQHAHDAVLEGLQQAALAAHQDMQLAVHLAGPGPCGHVQGRCSCGRRGSRGPLVRHGAAAAPRSGQRSLPQGNGCTVPLGGGYRAVLARRTGLACISHAASAAPHCLRGGMHHHHTSLLHDCKGAQVPSSSPQPSKPPNQAAYATDSTKLAAAGMQGAMTGPDLLPRMWCSNCLGKA